MNNFEINSKRKSSNKNVQSGDAVNSYIQPFKEMPSVNTEQESAGRINAHDLFSYYTAEIIKEDIIYAR